MVMKLEKLWSSKNSKEGNYLLTFEKVSYHLVAFQHLASIDAELICHTYADGPVRGRVGIGHILSKTKSDEVHSSIMGQLDDKSYYGEQSVWVDRSEGITIFLEILDDTRAAYYTKLMDLVSKYQNARDLEYESVVDDIPRRKEVNYYVCSVFFHHWFLEDLDRTPEPSFGVWEACARADVAETQGYRAMKRIIAFLRAQQFSGQDSAR